MIGKFDMGDLKTCDADLGAVENVIELSTRRPAGVGRMPDTIGIF